MTAADPRPLSGEPMSIDLLNTVWTDAAGEHDLLGDAAGLVVWLGTPTVAARVPGGLPAEATGAEAVANLRVARTAVAEVFEDPDAPAAHVAFNAVLGHGAFRRALTSDGPAAVPETDSPSWLVAWLAVEDYLRLLEDRPARLRRCANPACTLRFYDTSKNGTRRWCSMSGCGNRAKASRHYDRHTR
ncbi:CGNR zinc finger domain-containing protein [Yinghuangia seranimata]|uniref:CGNR zinc finger domain-containing protein n=1 Tax=Yinghuangia seranimata TaxID=408067 RepID=UPI00248C726F|nr:CGNR zinc finger domain-containing protein [Yinghuangia seranimata]MDI2130750.1 CGNR zinc finger domain-containing protein [Yinghuangia seranimata]